ncbi:linear amide C-N hydrolase [Candidatus Saccharibacteria bacterium]|jgi:hypothetical protein|nr:linear amide C-N hydrolase [Herbinix sp.]NLA43740.1 linear amide C-N hydrolase [Candidatus Saccharibacteria bacterium]NLD79481.1 linear amide C-N hydrolase [Mollicutes bacterium]
MKVLKKTKLFRCLKRILIILLGVVFLLIIAFIVLLGDELRTLNSLRKETPQYMYSMTYYADYHFDEFLQEGYKSDEDMERFIVSNITHGFITEIEKVPGMCSSFICRNEKGEVLFGRNFDYTFSPVTMLTTAPKDGFRCITAADIAFAGYNKNNLPSERGISTKNFALLSAPYLTTDGMNEYGVAMSILDCGRANPPVIEGAPTLNTSTAVRMVLEYARTVDEGIELMKKYNFDLGTKPNHFMMADSSGRSVVIEFYNGELVVVDSPLVTNFDLYDERHFGGGIDRYNKIEATLEENNGVLGEDEALRLLSSVCVPDKKQYSVLYNLSTGEVTAFTGGDCSVTESFLFDLVKE